MIYDAFIIQPRYLFPDLPGDYICRKDDIGKEMFIIQAGQVQVLGGLNRKKVLVTLGQGSVFGEIALLGVDGMNKRTADVVSKGFSNLFVLQKDDLELVLKDYPDAKQILNARARRLMKENETRYKREFQERQRLQENKFEGETRRKSLQNLQNVDVIFPLQSYFGTLHQNSKKKDPALLETVLKLLPHSATAPAYLRFGTIGKSLGYSREITSLHVINFTLANFTGL